MANAVSEKFKYDFNVIFNDNDRDTLLTKAIVKRFELQNFKGFYDTRDALGGQSIFRELIRSTRESKVTITILTKRFVKDSWSMFSQELALKLLIDKQRADRLIPIVINLDETDMEKVEILCAKITLPFPENWEDGCEEQWSRLQMVFQGMVEDTCQTPEILHHSERSSGSKGGQEGCNNRAVQLTEDQSSLTTDGVDNTGQIEIIYNTVTPKGTATAESTEGLKNVSYQNSRNGSATKTIVSPTTLLTEKRETHVHEVTDNRQMVPDTTSQLESVPWARGEEEFLSLSKDTDLDVDHLSESPYSIQEGSEEKPRADQDSRREVLKKGNDKKTDELDNPTESETAATPSLHPSPSHDSMGNSSFSVYVSATTSDCSSANILADPSISNAESDKECPNHAWDIKPVPQSAQSQISTTEPVLPSGQNLDEKLDCTDRPTPVGAEKDSDESCGYPPTSTTVTVNASPGCSVAWALIHSVLYCLTSGDQAHNIFK